MVNNINKEECSFSVDMADLVNYNDGVLSISLINKSDPNKRRVFYDTLTPLKIDNYIEGHKNQNSRVIKLKRLPGMNIQFKQFFIIFIRQ